MALAPFQMSTERAEVVDFTKPFMTKGTTVVVKRPDHKIGMFQFLSPFSHVRTQCTFNHLSNYVYLKRISNDIED